MVAVVVIIAVVASAYLFLAWDTPPGNPIPTIPTNPGPINHTISNPIVITSDAALLNMTIEQGWPGSGTYIDPFVIEGLRIVTDTRNCIKIHRVTEYYLTIRNCYFEATHLSFGVCVKIYESANAVVENCTMVSGYQGMDFNGSSACEIRDCTISGVGCGINTTLASNITVKRNVVSDCYLAMMIGGADHIRIWDNYFGAYDTGIWSYASTDVILTNVTITDNIVGLTTEYSCQNWTITECLFINNTEVGIRLEATTQHFRIYSNRFGLNEMHAQDNGASNLWDDGIGVGNAWADYSGIGVYTISGSAESVDNYPVLYAP